MLIGELARQAGCDPGTVRYYELEGLIQKPYRTSAGYRSYTDGHLRQLNFVRHCRSLGMALAEIKVLCGFLENPETSCKEIGELLDRQIDRVQQQIEMMTTLAKQLAVLRNRCHREISASECGILQELVRAAGDRE
jgi:DNA-binding transcriptional MerR regulator